MRWRTAIAALMAATATLLALPASASAQVASPMKTPTTATTMAPASTLASAPALGPDCKGEPPLPSNPNGHLAVRPAIVSTADPFATSGVSIQSVYGTNYAWWTYDNGCSPQDEIMPSLGANIGTLLGLELPGLLPSWGQGLFTLVVDPSGWIGSLDSTVAGATAATAAGVWFPWLAVAMTLVALLTMVRARRGQLSGSINAVAWALLVLVVTSWAVRYPVESVKLLDGGIQTAVVGVADGFDQGDFVGPVAPASGTDRATAAKQTLDRQWDTLTRQTVFRSWAEGVFGDPDGATARTYGPGVFKATHFSWTEYDTYVKDPAGAGARIVAAKAQSFRQLADQIQQQDPVAYDYFTGNQWGDRITTGLLSFVSVLVVALFLVVAGLFVVGAYVLVRLLLPFAPVAGVVFLVDSTRDAALALFRKVVKPLVMGPIFFLAALVVLRYNVGILSSDLPAWLQLVLVFLVAWLVWRMLRPATVLPRIRIPGRGLVSSYVGTRLGTERGLKAVEEDAPDDGPRRGGSLPATSAPSATSAQRQYPVHQPAVLPSGGMPLFLAASPGPEPSGVVATGVHVPGIEDGRGPDASRRVIAAGRGSGRGTFAPRDDQALGGPFPALGGRTAREVSSAVPPGARPTPTASPSRPDASRPATAAGPFLGHHIAPHLVPGELPPDGTVPARGGNPTAEPGTRAPSSPGSVEGRVLDRGELAGPPFVDESNLTYDRAGRRVFVVFTPAGRLPTRHAADVAPEGSTVEA